MIKNHFLKNNLCLSVFLSVLICVLMPSWARAAVLYFEPSQGDYYQSDIFIEKIWLDTEGEEINAGEINLEYPSSLLEVKDISAGGSIFSLWIKKPEISVVSCDEVNGSCGLVSLIGGVPNGFNGKGLIGKIALRAIHETTQNGTRNHAKIEFLDSSQVLLNDGKGTPAKLTTKGASFNLLTAQTEIPKNEWQEILKEDNIPPEPFEIELHKEPSLFDEEYFITFWTIDNQSGIDHYEVKEGKGEWLEAVSPYLLKDQSLKSIIKVKAVDKAGNERIETIQPTAKPFSYWFDKLTTGWIIIVLGLIGVGIGLWIYWKSKIKNQNEK